MGSIGDHVEHTKIQEERTKLASRQSRRTAMTKIQDACRMEGTWFERSVRLRVFLTRTLTDAGTASRSEIEGLGFRI